jgi:hypothetical protein
MISSVPSTVHLRRVQGHFCSSFPPANHFRRIQGHFCSSFPPANHFRRIQGHFYPLGRTLYSVFRIHSAHLLSRRRIVFGFSHTFGSSTLSDAHCIRFFAYIRPIYSLRRTLYSVFRIHSAHLLSQTHIVFGFSHTFSTAP